MLDGHDELFVGWGPRLPRDVARTMRRTVCALAALAIVVPLTVVAARTALAPATFEYGVARRFLGVVQAAPVPLLLVARPGDTSAAGVATSSLLLVAPGKHGASALAGAHDGRAVELTGTLAYRDGRDLIEVDPASVRTLASDAATVALQPIVDLGDVRLTGEIVDTKCHLGVMNPGDGKTHRACAARCISGGVPPALRVRTPSGEPLLVLLVGRDGASVARELLPFVAEPIEIAGRAERRGDLLVLYADPASLRRTGEEG